MEGSSHKHKRTAAQDMSRSLNQSIDLGLGRLSCPTDYGGPLTLRVTHAQGQEEEGTRPDKMKKSSIQERPVSRASFLKHSLLQLQQKLTLARRQLATHQPTNKRSTIGARPGQFQSMLGLFICNQVSEDQSTINLQSRRQLIRERQEVTFASQMGQYYTGHLVKALLGGDLTCVEHLLKLVSTMKQVMLMKQPNWSELQNRRITLSSCQKGRKVLLLELDGTMMLVRDQRESEDDVQVGTGKSSFYVFLRPYLFSFLKKIKQSFEVVVYTTLGTTKAQCILDELDPDRKIISDCLGKEHCLPIKEGLLCKDIRIINRNKQDIILLDSHPESIMLHPQNYLPILPFTGQQNDRELMDLQRFLTQHLTTPQDIRQVLKQRFKLPRYWQYQAWQDLVKELYL